MLCTDKKRLFCAHNFKHQISMSDNRRHSLNPIVIIGILFFIFGFITWLNALLIPYLQIACELDSTQSILVTFAFYISYFIMAFPSAFILNKTGLKNGMSLGLLVMAIGALIFIPAAYSRSFLMFLVGLFVQATGMTVLQAASNPYVVILGPIESAAKRISIMGVANKVAGILAPIIIGAIILADGDALKESLLTMTAEEVTATLDAAALKVIAPYIVMALSFTVLALWLRKSDLPDISAEEVQEEDLSESRNSIFSYPYLWLGALAIFMYVGVEVIAVDTIIQYGQDYWGFPLKEAKFFSGFTLGAMLAGYFIGIALIPKYISQERALAIFAVLGVLFTFMAVFSKEYVSISGLALLGFANSIMWPAIWPLAIDKLGKFTKTGSALLIMAIAGGAVLPWVCKQLTVMDQFDDQTAYLLMIPAYLYILFFAVKGHTIGKKMNKINEN